MGELGKGAMGKVYEVKESRTGERFALKLISVLKDANEKQLRRFELEAQALFRLKHPNIVKLKGSGIAQAGFYYLVMELVKGRSLKEHLDERNFTYPIALQLTEKLANALECAHQHNIIHRDLKPSNITINKVFDPIIMDFGVAKIIDSDMSLTRSGAIIGTPKYMSPEQSQGRVHDITNRSDIYSLGAILYEMLTGKPVIPHVNPRDILHAVLYETPPVPSSLVKTIPPEVDKICMKAIAKAPQERYENAKEFADVIKIFLGEKRESFAEFFKGQKKSEVHDEPVMLPEFSEAAKMPEAGEMFAERYQIQEKLGKGGMGIVYKALDVRLNRMVAVKIILSGPEIEDSQLQRFMQEMRANAQLEHPSIVRLLGVGDTPQKYFTMEYVEGQTFSKLIQENKISLTERVCIVEKIARALHYAHEKGIVHRDVKPGNIMVTEDKEPKIMDFGLAKILYLNSSFSKTNDMIGTPFYMSPEQAEGKIVDCRADVYSLGATLYEAFTGKPLFFGETFFNVINKIFYDAPTPPQRINVEVSDELNEICCKCLQKDPALRYNSAEELADALKKALENFIKKTPLRLAKKNSTPSDMPKQALCNEEIKASSLENKKNSKQAQRKKTSPINMQELTKTGSPSMEISNELPPVKSSTNKLLITSRKKKGNGFFVVALIFIFLGCVFYFGKELFFHKKYSKKQIEEMEQLDNKLHHARLNLEKKNFDAAIQLAQEILAKDPGDHEARDILEKAKQGKEQESKN